MPAHRKLFRIEQMSYDSVTDPRMEMSHGGAAASAPMGESQAVRQHHELIAEIKALRALVEPKDEARRILETYQVQLAEMQKLKSELVIIHNAINRTKQEILTLHTTGFHGENMSRMTHELDAVVDGTEQATQTILGMVEDIDQFASNLIESAPNEAEQKIGQEIQSRVVKVFEACNFQDITGQRISKVVGTWKFIENHVNQMMEIWGGMEAFKDFMPAAPAKAEGDAALLNGPKLDDDAGHASQDDIDALFP